MQENGTQFIKRRVTTLSVNSGIFKIVCTNKIQLFKILQRNQEK